jgi:hypothetical protein
MLNTQQIIHRSLECVWRPSDKGLSCMWVAANGRASLVNVIATSASTDPRRVA